MAEITQQQIENWIVHEATGNFHYTKIMDGRIDRKLYPALRSIMHRLWEKGVAFPVTGKDGWWRPADTSLDEINWWDTEIKDEDTLALPLGLNKYCVIRRPALIIVAGTYNAGKSTFCNNVVALNQDRWGGYLDYYVSENAESLKEKFNLLGISNAPCFRTYRRTNKFADVLNPDNLSVIDYLRVDMTQTYAISEQLFEIFSRLKTGIAVVAMQKPKGERKLAFGGASTAFEPTLYLGMESTGMNTGWVGYEKIKIVKPACGVDPYTIKFKYQISRGALFENVREEIQNNGNDFPF